MLFVSLWCIAYENQYVTHTLEVLILRRWCLIWTLLNIWILLQKSLNWRVLLAFWNSANSRAQDGLKIQQNLFILWGRLGDYE